LTITTATRHPPSPFSCEWRNLNPPQKRSISIAVALVVALYAVATAYDVASLIDYKRQEERSRQATMSPALAEPGQTPPDPLPRTGGFIPVTVGTYIENITSLSNRDSNWTGDFYIWFSWQGTKDLDPGGKFEVVDATITQREPLEEHHSETGANYQHYRIAARFKKIFNATLAPLDRPMLTVRIEDAVRDATQLRYVADPASGISPSAWIAGYTVIDASYVVKPHTYRSSFGFPAANERSAFSQYLAAVNLRTSGIGLYFKIFLCLFAALAFALAVFFIKPDVSPRFSLPAASYFGVVANSYIINAVLPPSHTFGLVEIVVTLALGTIFLTVVLSVISKRIYDRGEHAFALTLDRFMFYTIALCCTISNIAIPLSAYD
jgi:hypothetical protein